MSDDPLTLALRLEGEDLPGAILSAAAAAGLDFCDAQGFGELEWIDLKPGGGHTRRLRGPLDLLSLRGRLRRAGGVVLADWLCTVARDTDNGIEVVGGRLVAARGTFVELSLTPLGEASESSPRRVDTAPADEPAPAIEPVAAAERPAAARFAEALAESRRQEASAPAWDGEDEIRPARGDLVNHLQFGRCKVLRIDDDHITLRKPEGRTVQLGLPVLVFDEAGTEGAARVFDVRVRRD